MNNPTTHNLTLPHFTQLYDKLLRSTIRYLTTHSFTIPHSTSHCIKIRNITIRHYSWRYATTPYNTSNHKAYKKLMLYFIYAFYFKTTEFPSVFRSVAPYTKIPTAISNNRLNHIKSYPIFYIIIN